MRHPRRGGSLVEFALVSPLLFALLTGVIEWGWYLFQLQMVLNAASDGVRAGSRVAASDSPSPAAVASERTSELLVALGVCGSLSEAQTVVDASASSGATADLTVTIDIPIEPLIGFVPTPASYHASVMMRLEDPN